MQALEDTHPPLCFVIREYGILVTSKGSAVAREGVSAVEVWKAQQPAPAKPPEKTSRR